MSDADQDRSNGGGDDENGGGYCRKTDRKKKGENAGENCTSKKGNRVSLFRFRKVYRKNKLPTSSTSSCCFLGIRENVGGCFMCFRKCNLKQILNLPAGYRKSPTEDYVGSQETDPNSPGFTFELSRSMIEKNDFYSKECNTHLDVGDASKSSLGIWIWNSLCSHSMKDGQRLPEVLANLLSICVILALNGVHLGVSASSTKMNFGQSVQPVHL